MTDIGNGRRIYVDTNILVYYIDADSAFTARAARFVEDAVALGASFTISELSVAECIYKWHKESNPERVRVFHEAFGSGLFEIYPLTGDLVIRAAEEGGALGLKLLDAVHYMSALEAGCDVFATADRKFRSSQYLEVVGI